MNKTLFLALLCALAADAAMAGDTPRFRGPNGDGIFHETGLLKSWPDGGPPVAWTATGLGEGYSSAAVADGKVYITGMDADLTGHLFVLDMGGAQLKKIPYGKETTDDQARGPRSTPTVDGDLVYIVSGLGVAYCLDAAAGKTLWEVNLLERFGAENIQWTLAESVWLDGDRIICTPGGKNGALAALDKMTGATVWATTGLDDKTSYCSPAIITHNGRRLVVTETARYVIGVDAENGDLLWKHEHKTNYDIHAVTPVYDGAGLLYYSGGYGSGGGALKLSDDGASVSQAWTDKTLDCQHHGVVLVDGHLYGTAHKGNSLVCLEMATGAVKWNSREVRQGNTVLADGMLYIYEGPKSGVVHLVKPSPAGLESAGKFTFTAGADKHWAHPAIAHGLLLIRRGDALVAYNVKA